MYERFCLSLPESHAHIDMQSQPDTQDNANGKLVSSSEANGKAKATFATVHCLFSLEGKG